jgi:hypothetical protein
MTEPKLIFSKMSSILKSVEAIKKDRRNTQGAGFMYRGIDDMYNELHSSFADNGVFCTTEVLTRAQEERQSKAGGALFYTVCTVRFTFWAEDGSFVQSTVIGEAMDSGDKGTNKAMAIAHKYTLMQAFLIPTEEDKDPDGQSHQVAANASRTPVNKDLDQTLYTATDVQKRAVMVWAAKYQIHDPGELGRISARLIDGKAMMYELEEAIPAIIRKLKEEAAAAAT